MRPPCSATLAFTTLLAVGCSHTSSNRLNAPRCITSIECGEEQSCYKKEHHLDGVCVNKSQVPTSGAGQGGGTTTNRTERPAAPAAAK